MSGIESACILVNRNLLEWQVKALEEMVDRTGIDIPLIVVNEIESVDHPGFSEGASPLEERATENALGLSLDDFRLFFEVLKREGPWALVLAEQKLSWLLRLSSPGLARRHAVDDVAVLAGAERVACSPVPVEGSWCDLPEEVVDRIAEEADVAIRFGFNLLTGDILAKPPHGVLSFHPADIRRYRGLGPPQAFVNGDASAGSTLQQLTDTLDGGNVVLIESVDIADAYTLDEIYERVHRLQIRMLTSGIEKLRDPAFEVEPIEQLAPYTSVMKRRSVRFAGTVLFKNLIGRGRTVIRR